MAKKSPKQPASLPARAAPSGPWATACQGLLEILSDLQQANPPAPPAALRNLHDLIDGLIDTSITEDQRSRWPALALEAGNWASLKDGRVLLISFTPYEGNGWTLGGFVKGTTEKIGPIGVTPDQLDHIERGPGAASPLYQELCRRSLFGPRRVALPEWGETADAVPPPPLPCPAGRPAGRPAGTRRPAVTVGPAPASRATDPPSAASNPEATQLALF